MKSTAAWLLGVLAVSLFVVLGFWQLSRAEERKEIYDLYTARLNAEPLHLSQIVDDPSVDYLYSPVRLSLEIIPNSDRYVINKMLDGQMGVQHIALAQANSVVWIVDLGWLPSDAQGNLVSNLSRLETVTGQFRLAKPYRKTVVTGSSIATMFVGDRWPWVDIDHYRQQTRQPIAERYMLRLETGDASGHRYNEHAPQDKSATNLGYAGQWFLFALVVLVMLFYFQILPRFRSPDYVET